MAEQTGTTTTPTKKHSRSRSTKGGGHSARNRGAKPKQIETAANTDWSNSETPLPLPVAIRGFNQIVSRFCGKYPDRGFSATIDEAIVYSRQLRQVGQGQKTMTAGAQNA